MKLNKSFRGRIVQVCEALSFQDAVSDHVLSLHRLASTLGLKSAVYSMWAAPQVEHLRLPLAEMELTAEDVVVFHFCGHSEHALPAVIHSYCTRILQYHNITPPYFFPEGSRLFEFCSEGRRQLREAIPHFHGFWADSEFNLNELRALQAASRHQRVVPIVVDQPPPPLRKLDRTPGTWLFVGRIAPNKEQVAVVKLFAEIHAKCPEAATGLILAGGHEEGDAYYEELVEAIRESGVSDHVRLAGKVDDEERERLFQTAAIFVSMSKHEGFGVPIIEAALRGMPVVALGYAAIPETLGSSEGLARSNEELTRLIERVQFDENFRTALLQTQRRNAERFSSGAVSYELRTAIERLLPTPDQYRKVSVVLCTYNRRAYLERVLDYLHYQENGSFEVIVIDGPSTDGTKELLQSKLPHIKLGHNPERNLSKSRNLGIELADGDVIAFIDDDALPFDDWVSNILDAYNSLPNTVAALGGPAYYAGTFYFQAEDNGINKFGEAIVNIDSKRIGREGWLRYNTGTNATFSRSALRAVGGFDEQFDYYLDESDVCFRLQMAGYLVAYDPQIIVRHEFAQSHNRLGRLNYNWKTICKNSTYFIAAFSGLNGDALRSYIDQRMRRERLDGFDNAVTQGLLTSAQRDEFADAVAEGVVIGLADARHHPKIRLLSSPPNQFRPFPILCSYPKTSSPTTKLHICILSREFPPFAAGGGVGTMFYHLASELLLMGHKLSVIVPGDDTKEFRQGRFTVYFTPIKDNLVQNADPGFSRNMSWSITAMARLAHIHLDDPVDILESALWDTEALAIALLPAARRPKVVVRLVTPYALASEINGFSGTEAQSLQFMSAERALINAADAVIPISASIAASIEEKYAVVRDARWETIPCGIAYWPFFDVNRGYNEFPALKGLSSTAETSSKLLLFVGRLEHRKGVDIILHAAESILAADPNSYIVFAGRDVEGWAGRNLPVYTTGRVHFLGEVDNDTREKLMANAWSVLFPSRYESFGLVPLEAFVHGVPVIAARAGAIPEVVQDGVNGLLFDSESAEGLANCARTILLDAQLRAQLSRGALSRVRELSSRRAALATLEMYQRIL